MASDFLKNNPLSLRHYLLYEYLQNFGLSSRESSFNHFCNKVGEDVIDYDQFKLWFNQFSKKKFDDESICDLKAILRNDKKALRVCILYEAEEKEVPRHNGGYSSDPVFGFYNRICQVLGDDIIDYPEYYSYYQKFSRGEIDLEEIELKENALTLSDMSQDIMERITGDFYYSDRCALREVSHHFLQIMDASKFQINGLRTEFNKYSTVIQFLESPHSSPEIRYTQIRNECRVKYFGKYTKSFEDKNHMELALTDMKKFFGRLEFQMESWKLKFNIGIEYERFCDAFKVLDVFTSKLHVESVELRGCNGVLATSILPIFKPGVLQKLCFYHWETLPSLENFGPVFEMDQWKMASDFKSLSWPLPIENLFHFKKFDIGLPKENEDDLKKIRDILLHNPNFEYCMLNYNSFIMVTSSVLREVFGNQIDDCAGALIYPIPNSKEYFEIKGSYWIDDEDYEDNGSEIWFTRKSF